jgi:hypothetical protein
MEVLVVESEPRAADSAIGQLEALGHQVKRCHEPEAEAQSFPCVGLASGHCPLEEDAIDVVLTVRGHAHLNPTPLEDGITCALRRRVPVVIAGRTDPNPFEAFGTTVAERDISSVVERVASNPLNDYATVALKALDWTLGFRGLSVADADAAVTRVGRGLRVALQLPAGASKLVCSMAAVRVTGALRTFDPHASYIDVACDVKS